MSTWKLTCEVVLLTHGIIALLACLILLIMKCVKQRRESRWMSENKASRVEQIVEIFETGKAGAQLDTTLNFKKHPQSDDVQLNVNALNNGTFCVNSSPKPERLENSLNTSLSSTGEGDYCRDALSHCPGQSVTMK